MKLATEAYFRGRWQMVRLIESPTGGGPLGEFWGEASFEPAGAPAGAVSDAPEPGRVDAAQGVLDAAMRLPGGAVAPVAEVSALVGEASAPPNPDDAAAGATGDAGAVPAARGTWLRCRETGVLRFQGQDFAAGRVTFWRFEPGGAIEVTYEDGRPFHRFSPDEPEATHLCGADTYDVDYSFDPDCWWSRWRVVGPAKDYWMTTRFTRIPG